MVKQIPEAAVAALKAGNKVRAVKATRDAQKNSLKMALDAIEDYLARNPSVNDLYTQMRVKAGRKYSLALKIGLALMVAGAIAGYYSR